MLLRLMDALFANLISITFVIQSLFLMFVMFVETIDDKRLRFAMMETI